MSQKLRRFAWTIDVDIKFVLYVDKWDYVKRAQILNRKSWGYLDLQNKKEIGKIRVGEFMKIYATYCFPHDGTLSPELSVRAA